MNVALHTGHLTARCWTDPFVATQCCDTDAYGEEGLALCFLQRGLSFARCCPPPIATEGLHDEVVPSWWDGSRNGCDTHLSWLPEILAMAMFDESAPEDSNGYTEPKSSAFQADSAHSKAGDEGGSNTEDDSDVRRWALARHLASTWDFGLASFMRGVQEYYSSGYLTVDVLLVFNELISSFGDALAECAPAALLAGAMKAETILHRDKDEALRLATLLLKLLSRVRSNLDDAEHPTPSLLRSASGALERVAGLAAQHTSVESESGKSLTVDFVVPLCASEELMTLGNGFASTFDGLSELAADQLDDETLPSFCVHIYDTCGMFVDAAADDLTAQFLDMLPLQAQPLFRNCARKRGMQPVQVKDLSEDVPTGDVAGYFEHLANSMENKEVADITLLLHADFTEHVRTYLLEHVFGSVLTGSWATANIDFLYLGWRHEGPAHEGGSRVASHVRHRCPPRYRSSKPASDASDAEKFLQLSIGDCDGSPRHPLDRQARFGEYNGVLLENLWRLTFQRPFDAVSDNFGGYDFSQILVSRRAITQHSASYWRHLARATSARNSYELLPGTRFVSRRVDLTPAFGFNKGVCIWFEHMWHLLFDSRFFSPNGSSARDLRAFTRLGDTSLPLALRRGPDNIMMRQYWLSSSEQCIYLRDKLGCRQQAAEQHWHEAIQQQDIVHSAAIRQHRRTTRTPQTIPNMEWT
eukprot:TRINITY_DN75992_c0_g1_i1.p1 TRINITY_DN75992_c0_g1~~TRINITY_DN75992_c0_g1_i1.p1  ORF type:complete len:720 (-),score=96.93 TRINITY_DN75992_c0_g1_i1:484-2577(-)